MLDFMRKSPFGFILTAAALVLVASPKARETARTWAVKGTTIILDLVDQAKSPTMGGEGASAQSNVYEMGAYNSAAKAETTAETSSPSDYPSPTRLDPENMSPS